MLLDELHVFMAGLLSMLRCPLARFRLAALCCPKLSRQLTKRKEQQRLVGAARRLKAKTKNAAVLCVLNPKKPPEERREREREHGHRRSGILF